MKYLGVDFGLKRVGLAISEGELAAPWKILKVLSFADALDQVLRIIKEGSFKKVVVGLPEGKMGQNVSGFISALAKRGVSVVSADETLSSKRAKDMMIAKGVGKADRRFEDAYSAAEILQNYLDENRI